MGDIKIEIPEDLSKDIQQLGNNIAREIAIRAREELTKCYIDAIEMFYDAYDPKSYKRTWQLRYSYKKYYTNAHGNIFYGGVKITDERMKETHQDPNYQVLDLSIHGWHGYPDPVRGIYRSPEPYDVVVERRDEILDNIQLWGNDAITNAKTKYSYKMLF